MILVLLWGCALGWAVHRARIQRNAVAAIEKANGIVLYDWQWKNERYVKNGQPLEPKWLVDCIGLDYFGHVSYVSFGEGSSDAELVHVGRLTQLDQLVINGLPVTNDGLSHLKGLANLRRLILVGPAITDANLAHLRRLYRLRRLELINTRVTEAAARELQKPLPELWIIRE